MKKIVQTMALLFLAVTGMTAEPVITLTTAKQYGDMFRFVPVPTEAGTIQLELFRWTGVTVTWNLMRWTLLI